MCQIWCEIFYCNCCFRVWQWTKHICLSDFICETCWEDEFDDSGYFDYDEEEAMILCLTTVSSWPTEDWTIFREYWNWTIFREDWTIFREYWTILILPIEETTRFKMDQDQVDRGATPKIETIEMVKIKNRNKEFKLGRVYSEKFKLTC